MFNKVYRYMYLMLSRFEDVKSYSMELESVLTALLQIREVIHMMCFIKKLLMLPCTCIIRAQV